MIQTRTSHFGLSTEVGESIRYADAEHSYNSLSPQGPATRPVQRPVQRPPTRPFLAHFGGMLSTVLFLANRLTAANTSQNFDYEGRRPANDVQALYKDWAARNELTAEIRRVFRRGIWLDNSRANHLCFRVADAPDIPSAEDRLRPDKMMLYRTIESEGDGFRSYVTACMALLLSLRPICLLDEPELCLHPPQAHAIGQFIGRHAAKSNSMNLVATHSSHVLRGVIETTDQVKIIRLTRTSGKFYGRLVDYGILKECLQKPIVRTETIFDGIFADAVAIVEADGDRAVYEAARESMPKESNLDVLFIPVGGTGGIADTAALYRALRIPVAVVADLDLIMDQEKLGHIMTVLCGAPLAEAVRGQCQVVAAKIKAIPPTLTETEVQSQLAEWARSPCDWKKDDDHQIMCRLRRLAFCIDRMRRVKAGGVKSFRDHPDIQADLERIIQQCRRVGLFLVPVGELEYWARELMADGPSKLRKSEWANEAVRRIRATKVHEADIFQFMAGIEQFHVRETERLAVDTGQSVEKSAEVAMSVSQVRSPCQSEHGEPAPINGDVAMDEELKKEFGKLAAIIETLPPPLKEKAEAIVNNIATLLIDLGDATDDDVWSGKTFSSSNGIRLTGTLSIEPIQIAAGNTIHGVVGTRAGSGPFGP